MTAGGSSSTGGNETATSGPTYGDTTPSSANDATLVFPLGTETESVAIIAHPDNSDKMFIGFDDNLDTSNGFPLESGASLTIDLDVAQQGIYAVAETQGDSVRFIATR